MLPERFPPDDPREWLGRARSNLSRAKARIPDLNRKSFWGLLKRLSVQAGEP